MTYTAGRVVNDADAHTMETQDWLAPYLEGEYKEMYSQVYSKREGGDRIVGDTARRGIDLRSACLPIAVLTQDHAARGVPDAEDHVEALGVSRKLPGHECVRPDLAPIRAARLRAADLGAQVGLHHPRDIYINFSFECKYFVFFQI